MKKIIKIPVIILCSIIALFLAIFGIGNLAKLLIYKRYHSVKESVCKIPDIDKGFIPQSISIIEDKNIIIIGGYATKNQPSCLYVIENEKDVRKITLLDNGQDFTGHCGGLAISGDKLFLSNGDGENSGVYDIDLNYVLDKKTSSLELDSQNHFHIVDGSASFIFTDDSFLYVGEFHGKGGYVCNHPIETESEGTHYAFITKYSLSDTNLTNPLSYISICNLAQGFAIGKNGDYILSTSYGLASSNIYMYKENQLKLSESTYNGKPVFILENPYKSVKLPPMSEGIDYSSNGLIYQINESASNKYIFGKLFFANKIVTLNLW